MSLKRALLAATILTVPAVASAQPVTGLYIGAGAGANFINNPEKWDLRGSAAPGNSDEAWAIVRKASVALRADAH